MSATPATPRGRGRGGLGKYLRARGRKGPGRPAEFGKSLSLEDEEDEDEEDQDDEHSERNKYAHRQLGTNADRYEEPEVDPHDEQEPEPEVDLSSFLARQRFTDRDDPLLPKKEDDDVDYTLSHLPSSSSASNSRKNKMHIIDWDASMDELKQEKEAAEAVWDLKSRFRKNQTRFASSAPQRPHHQSRAISQVEDSRHIYKPPDADTTSNDDGKSTTKAEMEHFLDDLLS